MYLSFKIIKYILKIILYRQLSYHNGFQHRSSKQNAYWCLYASYTIHSSMFVAITYIPLIDVTNTQTLLSMWASHTSHLLMSPTTHKLSSVFVEITYIPLADVTNTQTLLSICGNHIHPTC